MKLAQQLQEAISRYRPDTTCLSGICYFRLDGGNLAKAEFVSSNGYYDGLRLTVLNRQTGPVDSLTVYLGDLPRSTNHTDLDDGETEAWDTYRPSPNMDALTEVIEKYLSLFRESD